MSDFLILVFIYQNHYSDSLAESQILKILHHIQGRNFINFFGGAIKIFHSETGSIPFFLSAFGTNISLKYWYGYYSPFRLGISKLRP